MSRVHIVGNSNYEQYFRRSMEPMLLYSSSTLPRLLVSYIPLLSMMVSNNVCPRNIASFGSGSCAQEIFIAYAYQDSIINCHDISDKDIPSYIKDLFIRKNNISFNFIDLETIPPRAFNNKFDFIFSIQTLEHIEDYINALNLLCNSVIKGGYLYIDTPYYHEEDDREDSALLEQARKRQWENNKHFHLGFSKYKMERRLKDRNFTIIDSGYSAYERGDNRIMKLNRDKARRENIKTTEEYILELSNDLKNNLEEYEENAGAIEEISYFNKPCCAIRILAKKL